MGQNPEQVNDGACCALCGCDFEDPIEAGKPYEHGYPVACEICWTPTCGYDKANADTF